MNINQTINKLLQALLLKDKLYKINSFKFYNEKMQKYSTKFQVLKRFLEAVYIIETEETELTEKYKLDYECYSKIDLMQYLADELKGSGENGE